MFLLKEVSQVCLIFILLCLFCFDLQAIAQEEKFPPSLFEDVLTIKDQPVADFQHKLLDLAFQTATKIPVEPHIKDRSRAQQETIEACIELHLPRLAYQYTQKIKNWRKGLCLAKLALYLAKHDELEAMEHCINQARPISKQTEDWRRDRIQVTIAQAYTWLGEHKKAEALEQDVVEAESGKVEIVQAQKGDEDTIEEQIAHLDGEIAKGVFDVVRQSLDAYVQLYKRFYEQEERRALIEEKIQSSWGKMPIFIRIELLLQLAEFAIEHSDVSHARQLVKQANDMLNEYQWRLEHRLPLEAHIIKTRYKAGETKKAQAQADAALELYEQNGNKIVNIWRADALRPLAEAYHVMGDTKSALAVYKMAVESGVVNPNSRPRAEDLVSTCNSMALFSVEPGSELWDRLYQIHNRLGQPW